MLERALRRAYSPKEVHMSEKTPINQFKNECLEVLNKVKETQEKIVITKRGFPVVEIKPIKKEEVFGKLKGTVHYHDDIMKSSWD